MGYSASCSNVFVVFSYYLRVRGGGALHKTLILTHSPVICTWINTYSPDMPPAVRFLCSFTAVGGSLPSSCILTPYMPSLCSCWFPWF